MTQDAPLYTKRSEDGELRLPSVAEFLAGATPCSMINGEFQHMFAPVATNTSRHLAHSLQSNIQQRQRHRSNTAPDSYRAAPYSISSDHVRHEPASSARGMPASSTHSRESSAPSTPASINSTLQHSPSWSDSHPSLTSFHEESDTEPDSDLDAMDAEVLKSCTTFSSSLPSTARVNSAVGSTTPRRAEQDSLFAVFRPGLSMAASGSTLAAMHKEWRARWPGEDEEISAEELRRKPFACPYCRRRFDRPSIRQTHINSHTGDRPHQCKFSGCTKTFSVLSNKYRHERSHEVPAKSQATSKSLSKNAL